MGKAAHSSELMLVPTGQLWVPNSTTLKSYKGVNITLDKLEDEDGFNDLFDELE